MDSQNRLRHWLHATFSSPTWRYLCLVGIFAVVYTIGVVKDLDGPMICAQDPGVYAFTSYYFEQNITWLPVPHLQLRTDWSLYPYGVDHTFLHWSFERDVLSSLLASAFGPGPWFQFYALASQLMLAIGAFFIARRDLGPLRAGFLGLSASFLNFYVVYKFPAHLPYAVVHWSLLGILVDYLLVRRFVAKEPMSARLWALRLALLGLTLGLDLGYVAGFSLTSFVLTALWLTCLQAARSKLRWHCLIGDLRRYVGELRASARRHRATVAGLASGAVVALWLYVPLSFQIARSVWGFSMSHSAADYWSSPLRLFLPYLPGFHPLERILQKGLMAFLGDRGEFAAPALSPGLWLTVCALVGLILGRRHWKSLVPVYLLMFAVLAFHPSEFPTLHVFPWFSQARLTSRGSLVVPLLLALLAVQVPRRIALRGWVRPMALALLALAALEISTAYSVVVKLRQTFPACMRTDEGFQALMQTIDETPGVGLFEWPFSLATGTGPASAFHDRVGGSFQLAQFHHKHVMGFYFGRLPPGALDEFEAAGWPRLFLPDQHMRPSVQRRDFVEEEWQFLARFVQGGDFAGILLYPDLLPDETVRGFHERFGEPIASAGFLEGIGRAEFLPKRPEWQELEDPTAVAALVLDRPVFYFDPPVQLDLSRPESADYLRSGWSAGAKRWSVTERPEVAFRQHMVQPLRLFVELTSVGDQTIRIELNGLVVGEVEASGGMNKKFVIRLRKAQLAPAGEPNRLVFVVSDPLETHTPRGVFHAGFRLEHLELQLPPS